MSVKLEIINKIETIYVDQLSFENVFDHFFFDRSRILFVVDDDLKLIGIITLYDFLREFHNVEKALNKNFFYIEEMDADVMIRQAERLFEDHHILSSIPIIDKEERIIGCIRDKNHFIEENKRYAGEVRSFVDRIVNYSKSYYLQKEIIAFEKIITNSNAVIYTTKNDYSDSFFKLFHLENNIIYLTEKEYIQFIKKETLKEEKRVIICDFDIGGELRRLYYKENGLTWVYDIRRFMDEFVSLVENEDFSRLLKITTQADYKLKNFIADNGMRDIKFSRNRLLTQYVVNYFQENGLALDLVEGNLYASLQASSLVNGVRSSSLDCIGFLYCDLYEQQKRLIDKLSEKGIAVFHIRTAIRARVTKGETDRIRKYGRPETFIESSDTKAISELYCDDCNDTDYLAYAKSVFHTYPVRRRFENDIMVNVDYSSEYVNFENGIRKTHYQPEFYDKTIYILGPCFALGAFLEGKYSIPSLLAKKLSELGFQYRVINLGILASNDADKLLDLLSVEDGDIFISLIYNENVDVIKNTYDPSSYFNALADRDDMFFDKTAYYNSKGAQIYVDYIYDVIKNSLEKPCDKNLKKNTIYNVFKPNYKDLELYHISDYIDMLNRKSLKIPKAAQMIGCIVMNCNPFTLGHKYLVEYALSHCDYLFVFIVQEDKSYFHFSDRFRIAMENCKCYESVCVIPSGNLIASNYTFPEYFKREEHRDNGFTSSSMRITPVLDFRVFGSYIAPVLRIKKRFIAEEPLDKVTRQYNQYMKRILSEFDIDVVEIPRKTLIDGEIISASKVRKMYKERSFDKMREMLPDITYSELIRLVNDYLG